MSCGLEGFSPEQLALLAPLVALALNQGLNEDEVEVFSAFLTSVADLMALIATQNILLPEV